jgi:hypothetical protein
MVGKEVVSTVAVANVSAGAEVAKLAPLAAAFTIGGLTPFDLAYILAGIYSVILILHFVVGKWILPLWRMLRDKRAARDASGAGE